ncbi:hypothetical protein CTKA_01132 [Chthonomonas calidirosea]|uniref:Uncharacterized protein n=1 Tax=Chthonomonas calidirosea (strain DSM 23976 / ICMP 18418 / T49) TaxID=1303518 RepID=S0ESK5_CHTCT|nr:hypothetical protein [Chthonomonas calidirosea]CCW33865.1 hypothetical protein CCALI_00025 [Chthonomonas calidirosea T49]CEK16433.1 hypothetical protein CTKA_01132 [Chthonomonas calidirosea]
MEYIITMERLVEDNPELRADLCTLRRRYGFPITDSADPEEREKALNRWVGSAIHDLQAFQT